MEGDWRQPADQRRAAGWREWVALPGLGIPAVKAKLDTGARTSALHVADLKTFEQDGRQRVRFVLHPLRRRPTLAYDCIADVIDRRLVSDSGGHRERRLVIRTALRLGSDEWPIELTLTNRENMLFRLLLGRSALGDRFVVDPRHSFLHGRDLRRSYRTRR